jgi:hypothetical protein
LFSVLSQDQLKKVARLQMKDVEIRLAEKGVTLEVTDAALNFILQEGYDPVSKTITVFFFRSYSESVLQGGVSLEIV